jgi:hypothetical protein
VGARRADAGVLPGRRGAPQGRRPPPRTGRPDGRLRRTGPVESFGELRPGGSACHPMPGGARAGILDP